MITDSAVGAQEENNLRHLVANLGAEAAQRPRRAVSDLQALARVLPRLRRPGRAPQLLVARRARRRQAPRPAALRRACVAAARSTSARGTLSSSWAAGPIRRRRRPRRSISCSIADANADFYLTQIVSHHQARARRRRFSTKARRRGLTMPASSACSTIAARSRRRWRRCRQFLPVPVEELDRGVRRGRHAGRRLRPHHPHAARSRRAALLHQQSPAARAPRRR